MENFSISDLKVLLGKHEGMCGSVSIYMPTTRATDQMHQNEPMLKNLINQAEAKLVHMGVRQPEVKKYMQPLLSLPQNQEVWMHLQKGLAIFLAPDMFKYYTLPVDFDELVVVSDRFHIKPLIPILGGETRFFVLALSQKHVRLLKCSQNNFEEVKFVAPTSLDEALRFDEEIRTDRIHSGGPNQGRRGIVTHGVDWGDIAKEKILGFFQQIDKGMQPELASETSPLIIAGVEYLHPIYRQANSYRYLMEDGLTGSPDMISNGELHKKALSIVETHLTEERKAALNEYGELTGKGHTSTSIEEIAASAYGGQVETLFVDGEKQVWGMFDPRTNKATVSTSSVPCDDDLMDFAAAHTLLHRGRVFVLKPEEMPEKSGVAAIYRHERHARTLSHKPVELRASEIK
jgi:hypothetical protein